MRAGVGRLRVGLVTVPNGSLMELPRARSHDGLRGPVQRRASSPCAGCHPIVLGASTLEFGRVLPHLSHDFGQGNAMSEERLGRLSWRQHLVALAAIAILVTALTVFLSRNQMSCHAGYSLQNAGQSWVCMEAVGTR